jgi:ABC-2 family transporter
MIWLTWRQFRVQAWVALAALATAAIALALTGPHLASLYNTSGIPACHAHGDCAKLATSFLNQLKSDDTYRILFDLSIGVLFAVPAIIGVFWGAPLITRELEAGTFRLAWNQSVTRARWIVVKLGLIGLASMAAAGLFSLIVTWWTNPIERAAPLASSQSVGVLNRLAPVLFDARGIAPIGYAAFAFALGVTVGLLIRRTVPAMAITLAIFAVVQVAMPMWVRPHLIAPVRATTALNPANIDELSVSNAGHMTVTAAVSKPGAWILSNQTIKPSGQMFTGPVTPACLSNTATFQACQNSLARLHLRQQLTFQPASRYWALQWYETAIFLIAALALAGFCFWWVRRRRLS